MKMDIKVIKIGGAVFSTREGVKGTIALLNELREQNAIIIVSALGKSTSLLKELSFAAKDMNNTIIHEVFTNLKLIYSEFEGSLFGKKTGLVKDHFKNIEQIVDSIKLTRELSLRVLDRVLAYGEIMTAELLNKWLIENKFYFEFIPATELIITSKDYGKAKPIDALINKNVQEKIIFQIDRPKIILTQGFIASSASGDTTTMGYESSNLTAALLAREVNAKFIEIWTLPEGIRSADPLLFDNPALIGGLSYKQAIELADSGLKLLHKGMLEYAEMGGIELIYRSAIHPDGSFTSINRDEFNHQSIVVVNEAGESEIKFLYISKTDVDALFNELRRADISKIEIYNYQEYHNITIHCNQPLNATGELSNIIKRYI